jgi:flagellar biosynthesis/type III secretory pathway protein FliH
MKELLRRMETTKQSGGQAKFEVFQYPGDANEADWPAGDGWLGGEPAAKGRDDSHHPAAAIEAGLRTEFDRKLAEETRRSFEAGRERGRLEGRQAEVESQAAAKSAAEQQRMRQATELIESFEQERERYLQSVEHEVVELALAIAARILRREAQMDPLLLTGAVRVALGQLAGATEVRLKVPAAELDLWTEAMALLPNLAIKPVVLAGEGMRLGDCLIETEMGAVDLGIRPQLGEIERGFFDRPGASLVKADPSMNQTGGRVRVVQESSQ